VVVISDGVYLIFGSKEGEMIWTGGGMSDIIESFDKIRSVDLIIDSSAPSVSGFAPCEKRSGCRETSFNDFG
jgi:hypothetical protein